MGHKYQIGLIKEINTLSYSKLDFFKNEFENLKKFFRKYNLPVIDVTRELVEKPVVAVIRTYTIKKR
tara:strand:+ start:278 stop:478 length:201 start_codon:yes stop_codon:yes gene_type:complete